MLLKEDDRKNFEEIRLQLHILKTNLNSIKTSDYMNQEVLETNVPKFYSRESKEKKGKCNYYNFPRH